MQYAKEGDLHKWLQKSFADVTWNKKKLSILWQISEGLETIHKANFIHRDFHSGNILFGSADFNIPSSETGKFRERHEWKIGDLGLSQPANNTSSNNEIYGVIPYIAPEIFKGSSFSKETDIYCIGYTSIENDLDIDIERSNVIGTKRNIEELNINSHENNVGKYIKIE
ncbi:unnamed protein product [Rhizophagus irregularis]|nr:unnamed protein product [Rhizophagus irregularis]